MTNCAPPWTRFRAYFRRRISVRAAHRQLQPAPPRDLKRHAALSPWRKRPRRSRGARVFVNKHQWSAGDEPKMPCRRHREAYLDYRAWCKHQDAPALTPDQFSEHLAYLCDETDAYAQTDGNVVYPVNVLLPGNSRSGQSGSGTRGGGSADVLAGNRETVQGN